MYKVICIIGKSGVGKDTLAKELMNSNNKFHFVKSYTTREVRKNDSEDMKTHTFVSEKFRNETKEEILAEYINEQKGYCSWVDKTLFDKDKINLFVIDIDAFIKLNKRKDMDIRVVYLQLSEIERERRYKNRNKEIKVPKDKHLSLEYLMVKQPEINNKINIINTNQKTPSQIKDDVLKELSSFINI